MQKIEPPRWRAAQYVVFAYLFLATDAKPAWCDVGSVFETSIINDNIPQDAAPQGMVWIPGGEFSMGSLDVSHTSCPMDRSLRPVPDAQPIHRVYVDGFWMDQTEVTNEDFLRFVLATKYVTVAERPPQKNEFPEVAPEDLVAGSAVFSPLTVPATLTNPYVWWRYVPGANWRHPSGPRSSIKGREKHPVVHIAYEDAVAYAAWANKRLPTEAEYEFAARGGMTGKAYAWGDEFQPNGKAMANTFQGDFPSVDTAEDGYAGTAPVKSFPANSYGLYDIAGNVWEWCSDWYHSDYYRQLVTKGEIAKNPKGPDSSFDPLESSEQKRVQRGGSFLCTDKYCTRYVVGSRGKGEVGTATNHVGFRCVKNGLR